LVAHCGRRRAREIEEEVARRLLRSAGQVVDLVDTIERGLDDAGILAGLDLLLQSVALGPAGDLDDGGKPVQRSKQLVLHRTWPNHAGPTDDRRGTIAAFPSLAFLALEWGDATVGEGGRLGPIVSREDDDGVVGLSHVVDLLEHEADVVVHLLHAGFVDAPILPAAL